MAIISHDVKVNIDLSLHLLGSSWTKDRRSIIYELQNLDHNSEPCSIVSFLDSSVSSVILTYMYYFLYVLFTSFVLFLYAL